MTHAIHGHNNTAVTVSSPDEECHYGERESVLRTPVGDMVACDAPARKRERSVRDVCGANLAFSARSPSAFHRRLPSSTRFPKRSLRSRADLATTARLAGYSLASPTRDLTFDPLLYTYPRAAWDTPGHDASSTAWAPLPMRERMRRVCFFAIPETWDLPMWGTSLPPY
ncbi:hypothetical protein OPV22_032069 [Ensete ventricosum]|uniref:Uncharacterized protein n=1 Tax=Ensete ventricosum TaxID=4639 RepID=A0AAV8PQM0_ENSVE|nr:hypothetical protein OPV22_032069 [Ensete ventricosum]